MSTREMSEQANSHVHPTFQKILNGIADLHEQTEITLAHHDIKELLLALSDSVDELDEMANACAECNGSGASITKIHQNLQDTNCDDCNGLRWASQLCERQIAKLAAKVSS